MFARTNSPLKCDAAVSLSMAGGVTLLIPKSLVCRVCHNSENRLGTTGFCVTICQCLERMLLPNRLVFKVEGAATQRKMPKRTFPSLFPAEGAGSVVYSRECFIPVRDMAFLFPLIAVELWELTQDSGCLLPVGLLSSVIVN